MTAAQMVQSLRVKIANIQGEANSGRAIPPAVLALGLAEIQEMLRDLASKVAE